MSESVALLFESEDGDVWMCHEVPATLVDEVTTYFTRGTNLTLIGVYAAVRVTASKHQFTVEQSLESIIRDLKINYDFWQAFTTEEMIAKQWPAKTAAATREEKINDFGSKLRTAEKLLTLLRSV